MKDEYVLIKRNLLETLLGSITAIQKELDEIRRTHSVPKKYYDNKDIREMLKVNDKLIRKYRELGMLGYSQYGGKYWYSSEDIKCFLEKCRCRS